MVCAGDLLIVIGVSANVCQSYRSCLSPCTRDTSPCYLLAHYITLHISPTAAVQELFEPLHLMYKSLLSTGDESTANHKLLDVLRQVQTFGLSLMKLDIRQESTRHAEVGPIAASHISTAILGTSCSLARQVQ